MLAESSMNPDVTYTPDVRSRSKRLKDVKKGAEYHQKLDNLAESQWKSNIPKFPAVSRKFSTLPTITTSVLSDPDVNLRRSTFQNMTSTPRQSFSMMSGEGSSYTSYTLTQSSQVSLPNLSRIQQRPGDFDATEEYAKDETNFNPWGTNHSPLEDQTKLTKEDMQPRELPFRFRDSRKLVVKPTPRKSIPMSRVATQERDRHQRTVTNFRSRNGTIRVIKPLEPLPEIEKFHVNQKTDAFDIENIEREKTFMMLERIDRILHPNKRPPKKRPGSSEEEVVYSSDTNSTKTITGNINNNTNLSNNNLSPRAPSNVSRHRSDLGFKRRDTSKSGMGISPRRNVRFKEDPFKKSPRTFPEVLHSLEVTEEDIDSKCQMWIDRCIDDPFYDVAE